MAGFPRGTLLPSTSPQYSPVIGDCMMTVGTNDKTALNIHTVKFLPSHDYAVTDIKETNDERWVTLLDSTVCSSDRVLDIRWDDICATFEGLYISWNPSLFGSRVTFHGSWQLENAEDLPRASTHHLRLNYNDPAHQKASPEPTTDNGNGKDSTETEIWILLTRHLRDTHRTSEYIAMNVQEDDLVLGDPEHVALNVRFFCAAPSPDKPNEQSNCTNSTHLLSRIKTSQFQTQSSGSLSLLACYDGQFDQVGFTVTAFAYSSDVVVSWDTRVPPARYMQKIDGVLTHKTAGGIARIRRIWRIRSIICGCILVPAPSTRDISLNVTAVWSQGERISELSQKEVVAHSGPYTYGHARVAAHLAPGDYTVVLSAFEPDQTGKFTLKVESPSQFEIKAIPQEGAGMYVKTVRGEWDSTTAVGGPSQNRYHHNPVYEVTIPCASEFGARLQLLARAPGVSTNLSLFPSSSPTLQRCIASSGPYSDALSGVDIAKRGMSPGKYYLVPSTYHAGVVARFRIVVYSGVSGIEVVLRSGGD
ncbi:hypothetical protein EV702DRAFT_1192623 [Suillus placidus]|uniref:Calpain catalytic domain-containing protein n=1 Tax=Suillus placidus TaxID=48579 RepID=A0A9P7D7K3_9AGAM|nr:hypothetical protein EV702DRAFT_1192623 [Suillus placidus]